MTSGGSIRVSVILPTRNRATTLPRAIRSVLCQSVESLELIVVDDASVDNTHEVVRAIEDSRIVYLRLVEQGGVSAARNEGLARARGEFIAFQDSDDEWITDKLAQQLGHLESHPEQSMVFSKLGRVIPGEQQVRVKPTHHVPENREEFLVALMKVNLAWTQTWLVRADVFHNGLCFDHAIRRGEDWDLAIAIAERYSVGYLPELLVLAHESEDSLVARFDGFADDLKAMMDNHAELLQRHPDVKAQYCRRIASLCVQYGSQAEGRRWAWRSVKLQPFLLLNLAVLASAMFPKAIYMHIQSLKRRLGILLSR